MPPTAILALRYGGKLRIAAQKSISGLIPGLMAAGLTFGCSSPPPPSVAKLVDPVEEKLITLSDKLAAQDAKLAKLQATLDSLSRSRKPPKALKPEPASKLPVVKLDSDGRAAEEDDDLDFEESKAADVSALQGHTIVDSTHETMQHYYRGAQMMEEKRYDEALKSFREFLRTSPSHVYADRAQAWITEAHYLNKEYGLVLVASNLLESRYPESFKLPEALWKRALSYEGMGQQESARSVLRDLLKRYPSADVAETATRKLAELGPAAGAPPLLDSRN